MQSRGKPAVPRGARASPPRGAKESPAITPACQAVQLAGAQLAVTATPGFGVFSSRTRVGRPFFSAPSSGCRRGRSVSAGRHCVPGPDEASLSRASSERRPHPSDLCSAGATFRRPPVQYLHLNLSRPLGRKKMLGSPRSSDGDALWLQLPGTSRTARKKLGSRKGVWDETYNSRLCLPIN